MRLQESPHFARNETCKESKMQAKMVDFGNVWNLLGTENARKNKVKSARKGNCKK